MIETNPKKKISGSQLWLTRSSDYTDISVTVRRITLDSDGNLRAYGWHGTTQSWQVGWSAVEDQCQVYGWCGNSGICVYNQTAPYCICPSLDFAFVDPKDPMQGCVRKENISSCPSNQSMVMMNHTEFLSYPPESSSDKFFLGFTDCRQNCLNNPTCSALVWTAGRGAPVNQGAQLKFQSDGDLVLLNGTGSQVWKSGTANKGVVSALMGDDGNLVLKNRSSGKVWESFNNPTDTLLVEQVFTVGQTLSTGYYSFSFDYSGNLSLKWQNNITYWNVSFSQPSSLLQLSLNDQGIFALTNSNRKWFCYWYFVTVIPSVSGRILCISRCSSENLNLISL